MRGAEPEMRIPKVLPPLLRVAGFNLPLFASLRTCRGDADKSVPYEPKVCCKPRSTPTRGFQPSSVFAALRSKFASGRSERTR